MDATKNVKTAQEHVKSGYPTSMTLFMVLWKLNTNKKILANFDMFLLFFCIVKFFRYEIHLSLFYLLDNIKFWLQNEVALRAKYY